MAWILGGWEESGGTLQGSCAAKAGISSVENRIRTNAGTARRFAEKAAIVVFIINQVDGAGNVDFWREFGRK
jgi:hypothetical protein